MPKNIKVEDFLTSTRNCRPTFQFYKTDDSSILKIINESPNKTSTGFDDLSMRLIKLIVSEIIPSLTCIFNQSLHRPTGISPDKLKITKVIPIYKKGSLNDISNYRPISLLPSISKIFEKLIFIQLSTYLNEHKLLLDSQYGFRKCCRILTSLSQCGSYPQIPGRRLTGMTASLSYRGDVRTQSSVVRPLVFFPHLKRDTQRLRTCRSSLSLSP